MEESGIDFAKGVDPPWTNDTPNDGGRIDGPALGTAEAVGLILRADIVDIAKHPECYSRLRQRTQYLVICQQTVLQNGWVNYRCTALSKE